MLDRLKSLFASANSESKASAHDLELAAAALLVEVGHADHDSDPREAAAMIAIACKTLQLDKSEAQQLLQDAKHTQSSATSLYEFTELLNRHFSKAQKVELIEDCWRVAFADGDIDRYEDHMIRKIAELLYVSHADFIRAKLKIADTAKNNKR
ncbi:MAG: TerB family tellurite resistance protein [Gammaproteobacteria bacterium]|nr:TerB family tellurite resistance protein [Gammaproteobacteria bacterium]MBT8151617.1 TerB family tellurite resistance protein [Gammaproteobacteria bacterium]NND38649.1 TerB family tellurite resistance protein [Pseudomonadales bacterium]NNL11612.1 TerB family tellurite resistance protein [Pseudomonadales bacterium]NNM11727.1 TerB family tellurite resistance protein [Pseudomonadales bacterium]